MLFYYHRLRAGRYLTCYVIVSSSRYLFTAIVILESSRGVRSVEDIKADY
jgi:hypothetical protein